jgi:hypothetical protein
VPGREADLPAEPSRFPDGLCDERLDCLVPFIEDVRDDFRIAVDLERPLSQIVGPIEKPSK